MNLIITGVIVYYSKNKAVTSDISQICENVQQEISNKLIRYNSFRFKVTGTIYHHWPINNLTQHYI